MNTAVIILAAGLGTRMKSTLPKVLHPLCGRPMLHAVLETALSLSPSRIITVVGPGMEEVEQSATLACPKIQCVVQHKQLGTADAVKAALPHLEGFTGTVMILYGDTPLIHASTLTKMQASKKAVTVLGFDAHNPAEYGRMIVNGEGELLAIVEFRDASDAQRQITLCNSGVMAVKAELLPQLLAKVKNTNAKQEYYLTDIIALARQDGYHCGFIAAKENEVLGVNSRAQLAEVEKLAQQRLRLTAMENGATLIDPNNVTFCFDTILGRDVIVHPYVVFGKGARVEDGVEIRSFCHIEGAAIQSGAIIGPHTRLRTGSKIGNNAKIGNFVEVKNSLVGEGAKVNHLSYIGDTEIGTNSNIGAGAITCNYDGVNKHRIIIGKNTLIGSNTALIAPVTIGNNVVIGAGSVITSDVSDDTLSIARPPQVNLEGTGKKIRERKKIT